MTCGRWSSAASKVLARAVETAARDGSAQVDLEHLAAALLGSGGEELSALLQCHGLAVPPRASPPFRRRWPWKRRPPLPPHSLALQSVVRAAESLSPSVPVVPAHLLAALLASGDPAAEAFLQAGITCGELLD